MNTRAKSAGKNLITQNALQGGPERLALAALELDPAGLINHHSPAIVPEATATAKHPGPHAWPRYSLIRPLRLAGPIKWAWPGYSLFRVSRCPSVGATGATTSPGGAVFPWAAAAVRVVVQPLPKEPLTEWELISLAVTTIVVLALIGMWALAMLAG